MLLTPLYLKPNEERRLKAGHLWVYSNEIDTAKSPLKNYQPGELVNIISAKNKNLGIGYLNPHTLLAARLLTDNSTLKIDDNFFAERLQNALKLRELCFRDPYYRLVFSESDYLPGLVIDRYGDIYVVQITTSGMENLKDLILEAMIKTFSPKAILFRNNTTIRLTEGLSQYTEIAYGVLEGDVTLMENGAKFIAPIATGQKTGWFYDQRDNRSKFSKYTRGKKVLDAYSYIGGFGILAGLSGSKDIWFLDSSHDALENAKKNATLNGLNNTHFLENDSASSLEQLVKSNEKFDVIIIDPPAFAKKSKDIPIARHAYQKLHELALAILPRGGILAVTSCSMHISRDIFLDILRKASVAANRKLRIIEELHQAKDHPIHPAMSETNYLKGFIAEIYE
jgi:23S rRNA (cytosine1962-C5)-methyltransferase